MKKNNSVCHFPSQPHCFSYGGFDFQMNRVIDLLQKNNSIDVTRIDLWDRNNKFQIAHFWGAEESHKLAIKYCKERRIRTIINVLFPPMSFFDQIKQKLKSRIKFLFNLNQVYNLADAIVVLNQQQANFAHEILGINKNKIFVIPTIVDNAFYIKNQVNFSNLKHHKYCLSVGTICHRKNQLVLMEAAIMNNFPVVFVGELETGEPEYTNKFIKKLKENEFLFTHIENLSPKELRPLYINSSMVSCVSYSETEPTCILEAMIFDKPLILADRPFARNEKFKGALFCDPNSSSSVANSLKIAEKVRSVDYVNYEKKSQSSELIIPKYIDLYNLLISN